MSSVLKDCKVVDFSQRTMMGFVEDSVLLT